MFETNFDKDISKIEYQKYTSKEKEKYIITNNTCALVPIDKSTTRIIELNDTKTIKENTIQILSESCEYYGSTLDGRVKGSRSYLGQRYKLPIYIEETTEIIFFPTQSLNSPDRCIWISCNNFTNYKAQDNNTIINFKDKREEIFPVSQFTVEMELVRATQIKMIKKQRINKGK